MTLLLPRLKRMNLRANLKAAIEHQGMSASQVARKAGVPKSSLSDWLAGAPPRRLEQVKKVADVLGLTVDELCFADPGTAGASPTDGPGVKSDDALGALIGDGWVSGVFEVRLRRIKR